MTYHTEDLSFGLSLLSGIRGNATLSPTIIRTALAMLYEGARGETAGEIARVAKIPVEDAVKNLEFKKLVGSVNAFSAQPCKLRFANGVWVGQQYGIRADFSSTLADIYRAEVKSADFERNAEGERTGINQWVSENTEGKIPTLFGQGSIDSTTPLVLATVLYFKGERQDKFNPRNTQRQEYALHGQMVQVEMMRQGRIDGRDQLPKFQYGEFDGVQVVKLPYRGRKIATTLLLPPHRTPLSTLETRLKNEAIVVNDGDMSSREFARLEVPKHELRSSLDLVSLLSAMGIRKMFDFAADFSGISEEPLFVGSGRHEAYFKTDEEGSEGAAATGFKLSCGGIKVQKPVEFVADRPFLEIVTHVDTGAVLFLNRVEDPR